MLFLHDLKIAVRSLARVPALWITVALTLALGIGANAAIFSVVRAVLLRPLANRDEDQLLYLRQSAPGIGQDNATFSIPEIQDIGSGLKSIKELGTFSEIDFTLVGLGTPREIPAGVVAEVFRTLTLLLAPFAPFLVAELWEEMGYDGAVFRAKWPEADAEFAREDEIEIPVQVNGKLRGRIVVPADAEEALVYERALADEKVKAAIAGKQIVKKILVPGKLVNIVVK